MISDDSAQKAINLSNLMSKTRNGFRGLAEKPTKPPPVQTPLNAAAATADGVQDAAKSAREIQIAQGLILVNYITATLSDITKDKRNKKLAFLQRGESGELPYLAILQASGVLEVIVRATPGPLKIFLRKVLKPAHLMTCRYLTLFYFAILDKRPFAVGERIYRARFSIESI